MAIKSFKIEKAITDRDVILGLFFNDINKFNPLSPEKEAELFDKIKQGCQKSREILFNSNLRFVVSVAKGYRNKSNIINDLIQEGSMGLLKAIDKFKPEKGFRFISYAVWWIRQYISQYLVYNEHSISAPAKKVSSTRIEKMHNEFVKTFGVEPTLGDYEYYFDLKAEEKRELRYLTLRNSMVSTSASIFGTDDELTIESVLESDSQTPQDILEVKERKKRLTSTVNAVVKNKRNAAVFIEYNGIFSDWENMHTLETIGDEFGVSREFIRLGNTKVIQAMREAIKNNRVKL